MSKTTNKYAPEVRERAVRMVLDHERANAVQITIDSLPKACDDFGWLGAPLRRFTPQGGGSVK